MKLTLSLEDLRTYELLLPETTVTKRAKISVKKTTSAVKVTITASDSVAMRAMVNGILKQLTVFEKLKNVSN